MKFRRNLLFFPALFIGIVVLIIAVLSRQALPLKPSVSKSRPVDVLQLKKEEIAPVVIGFGRVEPKLIWQAIAQVSGKVVYRNRRLEKGQILPAGTLLLRIDPIDYQLAVAKAQANVTAKAAALDKLFLDEKNIKDTLEIETHRLALSEDEFARKKKLNQKGLTSKSELDDEQQAFLSQKMRVLDLENQRLLLPDEKKIIQAELKTSQLVFAQATRDLEKTEVLLPVDSRIAQVNIEQDQFVTPQQIMLISHGQDMIEVNAQVSIHDMQILFDSLQVGAKVPLSEAIEHLTAEIILSSGSFKRSWKAKVTRLSDTVNLNQSTVGIILEIPLKNQTSKEMPSKQMTGQSSLVNGMFVEAQITGEARPHWVIPEQALHGDNVYLLKEGVLHITPVTVLFRRGAQVAVSGDFNPKDLLILNDVLPAVPGMSVHAVTLDGVKLDDDSQIKNRDEVIIGKTIL